MVPGYNSTVTHQGVEYHVQTEDLGGRAGAILTLVYKGGAIVSRRKTSYREQLGESPAAEEIKRLIDAQHQEFMRRAAAGDFAEPAPAATPAEKPAEEFDDLVNRLIEDYLRRRAERKRRP
jgi:hypothetical protein